MSIFDVMSSFQKSLVLHILLSIWKRRSGYMYRYVEICVHQSHSCGDLRGVTGGDDKLGCLSCKAGTNRVFVVMSSPIYLGVWSYDRLLPLFNW